MRKQVIFFASILILFTGMISAYSYNPSSLGDALDSLGEDLGLMIVFLISFALITVILNRTRFFEQNQGASMVISLMLSLGITYFGFYKSGFNLDISGLLYGFGFSSMALDLLIFFIVFGGCILLLIKFRSNTLLIVGILLLAMNIMVGIPLEMAIVGGILVFIWVMFRYVLFRAKNTAWVYGMPKTKISNRFYKK